MNEAKQTFEKFSKPNESEGEEQADKIMALDKDNPILGAIAFAYKDEVEAVDGYKKIAPMFRDNPNALYKIQNIIMDEERHKKDLEGLATEYALRKGLDPSEVSSIIIDKIMKHKAEEPAEMPMAESENGEKED